tara:strand:- start:12611 stop:12997 length:387 start_codon:yes stop_codon:yes gene_type:complete
MNFCSFDVSSGFSSPLGFILFYPYRSLSLIFINRIQSLALSMFLLAVAAQLISIGAVFLMGHTISRHTRMLGKRLLLGFTVASHPPRPLQGRNFYKFLSLFLSKTGCNRHRSISDTQILSYAQRNASA